jgi:hypothetical protein
MLPTAIPACPFILKDTYTPYKSMSNATTPIMVAITPPNDCCLSENLYLLNIFIKLHPAANTAAHTPSVVLAPD